MDLTLQLIVKQTHQGAAPESDAYDSLVMWYSLIV